MSDVAITVAGERLLLLPERAVYWEAERMLLVADLHFGKAAAFRSAGVLVPRGTTGGTLLRLDSAIGRLHPRRIVFLGDLLHAREGRAPRTIAALAEWRERHAAVEMTLVRGNHDTRAGDPPESLRIDCVDEPWTCGSEARRDGPAILQCPFVFAHRPRPSTAGYVLAGHVHPAVTLQGPGRDRARLPAFVFSAGVGILPAFGEFTGTADVEPAAGDRLWIVAGDDVLPVDTEPRPG